MRTFLVKTIPVVTLIIFVLIMLSGINLKNTSIDGHSIPQSLELISNDIQLEDWESANNRTENLSSSWSKIVKRIQFSSERGEINSLNTSIARLHGAIMAKDKSASLIELNEAYDHWDGLSK